MSLQRSISKCNPSLPPPYSLSGTLRVWLRQLRVHQYVKNILVFVPIITSHEFTTAAIVASIMAAVAFSLCASAVYIINDISDLEVDRAHPTKRYRPLAAGEIKPLHALIAVPILLTASAFIALSASGTLLVVIAMYFALTLAYTFFVKRKLMADVILLSILYTIRVIGGAVAISVPLSDWLLYFSIFIFTCLALVKRIVELVGQAGRDQESAHSRNYYTPDIDVLTAVAAACGMNAVTIFTLYVSSPNVTMLYSNPRVLNLICPFMIFWLSRILVLARRGFLDDDPIVFAIKDRVSWVTGLATSCIIILALTRVDFAAFRL